MAGGEAVGANISNQNIRRHQTKYRQQIVAAAHHRHGKISKYQRKQLSDQRSLFAHNIDLIVTQRGLSARSVNQQRRALNAWRCHARSRASIYIAHVHSFYRLLASTVS